MKSTVIITGGSRGIGKVIAGRCLQRGANVVICSRNEKELQKASHELDPTGRHIQSLVVDVSHQADCQKLVDFSLTQFQTIDALINNAGIFGPMGLFEENKLSEWEETIQINLLGTIYSSHAVLPVMKRQKRGQIINMTGGGVGGKNPLAHFSAYYTSKAAIASFTEVLARECEPSKIDVNCISPGAVYTHLTELVLESGRKRAGDFMYDQAVRQKKDGGDSPELTADLVEYLLFDKKITITGKFLSAVRDTKDILHLSTAISSQKYTIRRIDGKMFSEINLKDQE
jgi:3-oxoacyl-[acyl-carrier protein] reductase